MIIRFGIEKNASMYDMVILLDHLMEELGAESKMTIAEGNVSITPEHWPTTKVGQEGLLAEMRGVLGSCEFITSSDITIDAVTA